MCFETFKLLFCDYFMIEWKVQNIFHLSCNNVQQCKSCRSGNTAWVKRWSTKKIKVPWTLKTFAVWTRNCDSQWFTIMVRKPATTCMILPVTRNNVLWIFLLLLAEISVANLVSCLFQRNNIYWRWRQQQSVFMLK